MIKHTVIRKLRNRNNLTLEDLAAVVGVSPSLVSRYETGKMKRPSLRVIRALEEALGAQKGAFLV